MADDHVAERRVRRFVREAETLVKAYEADKGLIIVRLAPVHGRGGGKVDVETALAAEPDDLAQDCGAETLAAIILADLDILDPERRFVRVAVVNSPLPEGRGFRAAAVTPAGPPAAPSFSLPASTPSLAERAPRAEPTVPAG